MRLADSRLLLAAVCLQGCAIGVAATRWRSLLANQGIQLDWWQTARLVLIGLFFNLFYLGSMGGDSAKFVAALPHAPEGKARVAISLIQDRVIGLGALLCLLTGLIAWHSLMLLADRATHIFTIGVPVLCVMYLAATLILWFWPSRTVPVRTTQSIAEMKISFSMLRRVFPRAVFLPTMIKSLLIHGLVISAGFLTARAVGIAISLSEAGVVLGVTALALSLPITIAGLGVRDGMLIWLLAIFGFKTTGQAISLSICLLSISLFWAFAGGVAFFWPTSHFQAANGNIG